MRSLRSKQVIAGLSSLLVALAITSCQTRPESLSESNLKAQTIEINRIKLRLELIEKQLKSKEKNDFSKRNLKALRGHIKSITFRIGTKDDRLRIYWEDGSKSDLPCTKEQSIWACG